MTDAAEPDEFSFLAFDAANVGVTDVAPVRRVALSDGVSALAWGTGPARVALAHGAALNAHTWDPTLLAWGDASFLALDLPGHGDSAWRADADYSPAALAPQVANALDTAVATGLLASSHALVGHSLGGLTALELLRSGRAGFARLVLVDVLPLPARAAGVVASFLDGPTSFASREEIVERARAFGLGGASLERGVVLNTRLAPDGRVVWKHHLGALGPAALRNLATEHLWSTIADAATPIDAVAASLSLVEEAAWQRFAALRPAASLVRLDGTHNLQESNPVGLAVILRGLLG